MFMLTVKAPPARHPAIVAALRPFDILTCVVEEDVIAFGLSLGDGASEAAHNAGARIVSFEQVAVAAPIIEDVVEAVEAVEPMMAEVEETAVEEAEVSAEDVAAADAEIAEALADPAEESSVSEEEQPVAFCLRLTGSSRRVLVEDGLVLCRGLAGSIEFSEPPTAWDGADWTIRGTGLLSVARAACAGIEGASVSAI